MAFTGQMWGGLGQALSRQAERMDLDRRTQAAFEREKELRAYELQQQELYAQKAQQEGGSAYLREQNRQQGYAADAQVEHDYWTKRQQWEEEARKRGWEYRVDKNGNVVPIGPDAQKSFYEAGLQDEQNRRQVNRSNNPKYPDDQKKYGMFNPQGSSSGRSKGGGSKGGGSKGGSKKTQAPLTLSPQTTNQAIAGVGAPGGIQVMANPPRFESAGSTAGAAAGSYAAPFATQPAGIQPPTYVPIQPEPYVGEPRPGWNRVDWQNMPDW